MLTGPELESRMFGIIARIIMLGVFSAVDCHWLPGQATQDVQPGSVDWQNQSLTAVDFEAEVPRFRKGFFQGFEVSAGHLLDLGDGPDKLDQTFEDVRAGFGIPLGSLENILAIQPFFRVTHLNGPSLFDVPESVFETGVGLFNRKEWSQRFSTTLLISPMVRSDFQTSQDAFRLFGLGLVNWNVSEAWQWSVGVLHLDREDVRLLPAIGFVWRPTTTFKLDGMLPRPRLSKRVWKDSSRGEGWVSIGGSFGGNSWAVARDSGSDDLLTTRDFRVFGQYETVRAGRRGWSVMGGYAFGRSLEYERQGIDVDLSDALFAEAVWLF